VGLYLFPPSTRSLGVVALENHLSKVVLGLRVLALLAVAATSSACGSRAVPPSSTSAASVDARVASADGVSIHYVVEGTGPAVVLVHCLGCNLHYWDVAASELSRDHRVIRLDLAGHGGSGRDRQRWTVEGFVADVRAVADAAGAKRFTLVGHSMSGTVALETARVLGDRVAGVVPVDSVVDVDAHVPPEARAQMLAQMRDHYREAIDAQLSKLMPRDADPQVVARVRGDAMAMDPDRTAVILGSIFAYREDVALDHLAMPIVAIGEELRPIALDHNRAHAPQFDARIVRGAGHWLMLDQPTEFARTLRAVVESIEAGTAKRRGA
jgi:pimeloyl-ACP methyl ester carboxylesterase